MQGILSWREAGRDSFQEGILQLPDAFFIEPGDEEEGSEAQYRENHEDLRIGDTIHKVKIQLQ